MNVEKRQFQCRRCQSPILSAMVTTDKEEVDVQFQLVNVACLGCKRPLGRGDLVERPVDRRPIIPAVTN